MWKFQTKNHMVSFGVVFHIRGKGFTVVVKTGKNGGENLSVIPNWKCRNGAPVKQRVQLVALGQFIGGRNRTPQGNLHPGEMRGIRGTESPGAPIL